MEIFNKSKLTKLYKPANDSSGEENGLITIIGGSKLFHGAPLLSLKTASKFVDMVFFTSPEPSIGRIAERIKSKLFSFIWVPWEEVEAYIKKSNAVLIGPGLMRYSSEQSANNKMQRNDLDKEGEKTREITKSLLQKFPNKKWVIDAGSLQVMDAEWIPKNAILTPNSKEFELLFRAEERETRLPDGQGRRVEKTIKENAKRFDCIIIAKGVEMTVCSPDKCVKIVGGNAGLTKGGTGDVLAGLTAALLAKNEPFLAACSASYVVKAAADELHKKVGVNYSADDLAQQISETLKRLV